MFDSVVVGADDSATAAKAVEAAIDLAKLAGGDLHVVTAYKPTSTSANRPPGEFQSVVVANDQAQGLLDDLAARAQAESVSVKTHALKGDPAQALVAIAEREKADLIVVGNKGMQRRVLASIPNSVAHQAPCSVLIVKTV
jgi:nucleotide-binding universal stress UspA family protein